MVDEAFSDAARLMRDALNGEERGDIPELVSTQKAGKTNSYSKVQAFSAEVRLHTPCVLTANFSEDMHATTLNKGRARQASET